MFPQSKEYMEKSNEFREKVGDWLIYNPETEKIELKPGAPRELVELDKWLHDNYVHWNASDIGIKIKESAGKKKSKRGKTRSSRRFRR